MIWIKRLNAYGMSNWVILLLFVLSLFSIIAQMVGLGIFLPIFEFIFQNSETQTDGNQKLLLDYVNLLITSLNISVTLGSLLIVAFIFYFIITPFGVIKKIFKLGTINYENKNKNSFWRDCKKTNNDFNNPF